MVTNVQSNASVLIPTANHAGAGRPAETDRGKPAANAADVVEVKGNYVAALSSARDSVSVAAGAVDLALAAGRDGAQLLTQARDLARRAVGADDTTRASLNDQFQAVLKNYAATIQAAAPDDGDLLAGGSLSVSVDPDAAPIQVAGQDARLKASAGADDVLRLAASSSLSDPASAAKAAADAEASVSRLDAAMSRMSSSALKLSAHDTFLAALQGANLSGVDSGLDADGARLMALQVKQALAGQSAAIANAAPQSLLGLFRD